MINRNSRQARNELFMSFVSSLSRKFAYQQETEDIAKNVPEIYLVLIPKNLLTNDF